MKLRRMLSVLGMALATILALAGPAAAHSPVILDESDQNPSVAPEAVDGTDDFTWFGVLPKKHAIRSFSINLLAGQPLNVALAIPDKAPENALPNSKLPRVLVVSPSGQPTLLEPNIRQPFLEPDHLLNLLVVNRYSATAESGRYTFFVSGNTPSRFVVGTGIEGPDFDGLLRGQIATDPQVQAWYNTAP